MRTNLRVNETGQRSLLVDMTEEERAEMRETAGMHSEEADRFEATMMIAKADMARAKKALEAKVVVVRDLLAVARDGKIRQSVDVIFLTDQNAGKEYSIRMDTETVYHVDALESGYQPELHENAPPDAVAEIVERFLESAVPYPAQEISVAQEIKTRIVEAESPPTFAEIVFPYGRESDEEDDRATATLWALIHLREVELSEGDGPDRTLSVIFAPVVHDIEAMLEIADDANALGNRGLGTLERPDELTMAIIYATPDALPVLIRDLVNGDGLGQAFFSLMDSLSLHEGEEAVLSRALGWCSAVRWIDIFALERAPDEELHWPPVATAERQILCNMYGYITGNSPGKKKDETLRAAILEQRVEE